MSARSTPFRRSALVASPSGAALLCIAIFLALGLALFVRNSRLTTPIILGDEYYYSTQSDPHFSADEIRRTRQVTLPRTLILALWHHSLDRAGDPYFPAKSTNALLFAALVFPLYAVGRRLKLSRGRSIGAAAASVLLPFHIYSGLFMPESAYALTFWIAVATFLRASAEGRLGLFLVCGAATSLHYLVKPHGTILAVALVLALAVDLPAAGAEMALARRFRSAAVFGLSFLLFAVLGSFAVSGEWVDLGLYKIVAGNLSGSVPTHTPFSPTGILSVFATHWLVIAGVFACALPYFFVVARRHPCADGSARRLALFSAIYLVLQTASVAWYTFTHAEMGRVHLRYYDFAFPVLMLALWMPAPDDLGRARRRVIAFIGAVSVAGFWAWQTGGRPVAIENAFLGDAPELVLVHAPLWMKWTLIVAAAASVAGFLVARRHAVAACRVHLAVVILAIIQLLHVHYGKVVRRDQANRQAGEWLRTSVPDDFENVGVVVSPELIRAYSILFFFPGAPQVVVKPYGTVIDLERLAEETSWLYVPARDAYRFVHAESFSALRGRNGTLIDLTRANILHVLPAKAASPALSPGEKLSLSLKEREVLPATPSNVP